MIDAQIGETVLNSLHINHRCISFPNGNLFFFCRSSNGLSFDMSFREKTEENVRVVVVQVWGFVRTDMPAELIGNRLSYGQPGGNGAVIGFEVTKDGELNCFSEQRIGDSEATVETRIMKQLSGFSALISCLHKTAPNTSFEAQSKP